MNIFSRIIHVFPAIAFSLCTAQSSLAEPVNISGTDPIAMYLASGIDQEQESKIRNRVSEFQKFTEVKGENMVRLMKELRALSLQPDLDSRALEAKQAEINNLNNMMAMERNKLLVDLRNVMNSPQRKKFVKLMEEQSIASK